MHRDVNAWPGSGGFVAIPMEIRFWKYVRKTETCWLWTGATSGKGYGRVWLDGRMVVAHRVAYELSVGPIPDGMELDHVRARGCTSTLCVNPAHLEPVTRMVNVLRSSGFTSVNAKKTHCVHGHELSGENVLLRPNGQGRWCVTCRRAQIAARDAKRRASA